MVYDELLTLTEVLDYLKVSRPTFWRMRKHGNFPEPKRFGISQRWSRNEIQHFLNVVREVDTKPVAETVD